MTHTDACAVVHTKVYLLIVMQVMLSVEFTTCLHVDLGNPLAAAAATTIAAAAVMKAALTAATTAKN